MNQEQNRVRELKKKNQKNLRRKKMSRPNRPIPTQLLAEIIERYAEATQAGNVAVARKANDLLYESLCADLDSARAELRRLGTLRARATVEQKPIIVREIARYDSVVNFIEGTLFKLSKQSRGLAYIDAQINKMEGQ
jgi:hypothetical protein